MLTAIATLLIAVWLVLLGAKAHPSSTLTLIFGIVAGILVLVDLIRPFAVRSS